jgi:DNA ligase (NAD+)
VLIERAGDVIPKVVKVVEHKGKHKFIIPKHCPSCQGRVVREKEEDVAYRCINSSCPAQLERGLEHFAARDAMDVEGMGEAVVSQLVGLKLVKSFSDIFKLKEADLLKLELFKHKKARNLLSAIEKSKNRSLSRLIFALGIRHVGQKAALVLAQRFTTMDKLMNASPEELDSIYEVGPALSTSITDYFSLPQTKELISELRNAGLNFKEQAAKVKQSKLSGKVIVFTGELRGFSRAQAEALVRGRGGNPVSSVSKSTDFVVVGEAPGSKYEKAKQLGVKIITEKQFEELL